MLVRLYKNVEYFKWFIVIAVSVLFLLPYKTYLNVEHSVSLIDKFLNFSFLSFTFSIQLNQIINILVVLVIGIAFFQLLILNHIIERKNFLGLFFAFLCFSTLQTNYFSVADIFAVFFVYKSIQKLLNAENSAKEMMIFFDAGFLLGLAFLFNTCTFIYSFVIFAVIIINRQYQWRNWFVGILGLVLPFVFLNAYLFTFKDIVVNELVSDLQFSSKNILQHFHGFYWYFIIIILLSFISLMYIVWQLQDKKIHIRKKTWSLISIFFISLIGLLFQPNNQSIFVLFLSLPLAYFFMLIAERLLIVKKIKFTNIIDLFAIVVLLFRFFE